MTSSPRIVCVGDLAEHRYFLHRIHQSGQYLLEVVNDLLDFSKISEIDQERGVIIEEWRLRRGAAARMQDAQMPILLQGSHYADRIPIGTVENLETFPHDRLTQFYADWYRPDLMAVKIGRAHV